MKTLTKIMNLLLISFFSVRWSFVRFLHVRELIWPEPKKSLKLHEKYDWFRIFVVLWLSNEICLDYAMHDAQKGRSIASNHVLATDRLVRHSERYALVREAINRMIFWKYHVLRFYLSKHVPVGQKQKTA
jgi:hypothetical protein